MTAPETKMPDSIKAWHSTDMLEYLGSWATTRYPADAVGYTRADLTIHRDDPVLVQVRGALLEFALRATTAELAAGGIYEGDYEHSHNTFILNSRDALAALDKLIGGTE